MNDIVKYRNEFNLVGMRDWNKTEMDFLFAVMSKRFCCKVLNKE